ncbi:MAG: hypothetical protein ACI8RZ_001557 [Myxococcota bacterium]|jgi:hypothetical protein
MIALMMMTDPAAGADWRFQGGAEVNASPFGIADIGWRSGPWSVQLLTDTLDLRHSRELTRGKVWGAARLEVGAAGLILGAWTDGAPDPTIAMSASYSGIEGGWQRYLDHGLYAGVEGFGRYYWFGAMEQTAVVAQAQPLAMGQAVLGLWREDVQIRLTAGAHLDPPADAPLAPHLTLQGRLQPTWTLAPRLEVHAGLAQGQGILTTTRLGGLNPYVVPLAGAGWAEWWVEDYAAIRLGPALTGDRGSLSAVTDAAVFDGESAVGFGLLSRLNIKNLTLDTDLGYAPWITRQDGIDRWSVLVLLGRDWS